MWSIINLLLFTISIAGQLLLRLPANFTNSTNVVWLGPDQFTLPWQFFRSAEGQLWGVSTENDTVNSELAQIGQANFIALKSGFFDVIGTNAICEKMFNVSMAVHEAPIFLPDSNIILVSPQNQSYQIVIDLNNEPPTMSNLTANPPVDSINGAWLVNGTIIYGTNGIRLTSPPALYTFDPRTNISKPLLNNYRGLRFATPDDLIVDPAGNVLFTDAPFGYVNDIIPYPPEMPSGVWSFNPASGDLKVLDDSLTWPNGIALSPDNSVLYVTNTPLTSNGSIDTTLARGVYAFNYSSSSSVVSNRRLVYVPDTHVADGIKLSESGYIFTAAGSSIDVVVPDSGVLLGKIVTDDEVMNNLVALPNGEWWFTGQGGIWRARIAEQGVVNYG